MDDPIPQPKASVPSDRDELLIALRGVGRFYPGAGGVQALDDVSLTIRRGEFVCVMGPSGSGKSTFMNILGCLDRATSGRYVFRGKPVDALDADALAALRRDAFGFVFQSYNLIGSATAEENVELPAAYAGLDRAERVARARALLQSLGLGHRLRHRPAALSGGEQQRVAIARALMNGGQVVLADEPTGALDAAAGAEVLATLRGLAERGHTVVIITHDPDVARWAWRRIDLVDGRVAADSGPARPSPIDEAAADSDQPQIRERERASRSSAWLARLEALWIEARAIARSLAANLLRTRRLRTALTMLSVAIGVWAAVALLSVVQGGYRQGVELAASTGADTITIFPSLGQRKPRLTPARLTLADARAIEELANVRMAQPQITQRVVVRHGDRVYETRMDTTVDMADAKDRPLARGAPLTAADGDRLAALVVLGAYARDRLLPVPLPAVGEFVLVDGVPFLVKGVLRRRGKPNSPIVLEQDTVVFVPFKTAAALFFGARVDSIKVIVADPRRLGQTAQAVRDVLVRRHGGAGFRLYNPLGLRVGFSAIEKLFSALVGAVGAVSLVVGGMGVLSVMLVAVTERRREIGIRMATGARRRDIARQFLLEAAAVTGAGGLAGMVLAAATGPALRAAGLPVAFSPWFVPVALTCAIGTGLAAGFLPARRAAGLHPLQALAR